MAENPYIGQAMSFADAGMNGAIRLASALRSAADQQREQQEHARQQTLAESLDMARLMNEGWQVYTPPPISTDAQGQPTLKGAGPTDAPRPDSQAPPDNLVTLPHINKQLFRPAQTAQEQRQQQQQSYTDLQSALEHGGQPLDQNGNVWQNSTVPRLRQLQGSTPEGTLPNGPQVDTGMFGVRVPPPAAERVTQTPGGQQVYMPTQGETLADRLQVEAQNKPPATHLDTERFSSPVLFDEQAGTAKEIKLPAGVTPKEKPDKWTYNHFTDTQGNVHVTRIGEDGVPQSWDGKTWAPLGPNNKLGPNPQAEINARAAERNQDRADAKRERDEAANLKVIETLQGKADALDTQAAGHRQRAQAYQSAIGVENKTLIGDPEGKSQVQQPMTPALRTKMAQQFMDAKSKADAIDKQSGTLKQEIEARKKKFAQQGPGAGGQGPGQSAPQSRGQLTDVNVARQYLQKAGGDKAKAQALAKADGWEF